MVFPNFSKIFSMENKGFKVLNSEKKKLFLDLSKIFSLKDKGFRVLKNRKKGLS